MKHLTIDWTRDVELPIRACLEEYAQGHLIGIEALRLIDEIVARATKRGHELPVLSLDWEPRDDAATDASKAFDARWGRK